MLKSQMEQNNAPVEMIRGGGTRRNTTVDIVKGLGIFLMVWGHTDGPFISWIYLFHMAIFFIASGFCWNDKNSEDLTSIRRYVIRKLKTLYLPFVLSNVIYILLTPLFVSCHLYAAESLMDWKTIAIEVGKSIFFGGSFGFAGATWFIRTLFFVTIGHALLLYFTNRYSWGKYVQAGALALCAVAAQLVSSFQISLPKGLQNCFAAYLCYIFGICFRKYLLRFFTNMKCWGKLFVLLASAALLVLLNQFFGISLGDGNIVNLLVFALASLAGWYMLWGTASLLPKKASILWKIAGEYSIYVVLLHFLAFKIVSAAYVALTHDSISLLSSFPTIEGVPWLWIPYTIVGFIVPVAIGVSVGLMKRKIGRQRVT